TLLAHCHYLLHSKQCRAWQILFIVPDQAVKQKIRSELSKRGLPVINIVTPVALAQQIIRANFDEQLQISRLISCTRSRNKWLSLWLETTFSNSASLKRWQKHIATWQVPGIDPEEPLAEQTTSSDFLLWLWRQLNLLLQQNMPSTGLKQLVHHDQQALSELTLLSPLMQHYQKSLNESGEHDAKRLLERATDLLSRKDGAFEHHYAHFLVDEYQALPLAAVTFLETLCQSKQPDQQKPPILYAAADDLQLAEHFTEPTAGLAEVFTERFSHAAITRLPHSYRFNQYVAKCASAILNADMLYATQEDLTPIKLAPPLKSATNNLKKHVQIIEHSAITNVLLKLATLSEGNQLEIVFIGRELSNKPKDLRTWQHRFPMFSMRYEAVAQAKGVAVDYCFIVDVNKDVFPAPSQEQGLQYALFNQFSYIDHIKERSLFYLALTRARQCWVCHDPEQPSLFIEELRQVNQKK
ncbi:MAG: UvrD-helicase domain-containing protein, partial [Vibrionaceae bacterium]